MRGPGVACSGRDRDRLRPVIPQRLVERAACRATAWLRRHGHVDDSALEARSNEPPAQTRSADRGHLTSIDGAGQMRDERDWLLAPIFAFLVAEGQRLGARQRSSEADRRS
jgi:hypothetical protein